MALDPIDLGVNVDHVATLRQARRTSFPDPLLAALLAEQNGADSITVHLREDRRHIQDHDVRRMRASLQSRLNFEFAASEQMIAYACELRVPDACLVPERREELTTEGGLDLVAQVSRLRDSCARLAASGIRVSLFVDPDAHQLDAARAIGAPVVELHTGAYAEAAGEAQAREHSRIAEAARQAAALGLRVHAGHGLNERNIAAIAAIPEIVELNIGHAIVARAVFIGIAAAVREMKSAMLAGRAAAGARR